MDGRLIAGTAALVLTASAWMLSAAEPTSTPGFTLAPTQQPELIKRLEALESELASLKSAAANPVTSAHAEMLPPPPQFYAAEFGSITPPAPDASAKPKYPTVQINGFFQADALFFSQDEKNMETLALFQPANTGQPLGDIQDGAGFRRFRLSVKGAVADNVNYFTQIDFGFFGRPTFTDVWMDITDVPVLGHVRIGQWKQPFGLEAVTSVRYQTFLERSVLFQSYEAFRHIGVGFYNHSDDEHWTWAMSVFRPGQDQFGNDLGDNGGAATAGRLTWLPHYDKASDGSLHYLHLGGAYWFADPGNDKFRWSTIPEAFVGQFNAPAGSNPGTSKVVVPSIANGTPPFVDTGTLDVNTFTNIGTELLWVHGPISIQTEAQLSNVALVGDGIVHFWGFYSQVSWFATDESRPYDRKAGALDRVVPLRPFIREANCERGPGAWELALRISHIDLDDDVVSGGRLTDATAGMNWYLNGYTKIQFNYVRAMLNRAGINGGNHADIFGVRAQVDF